MSATEGSGRRLGAFDKDTAALTRRIKAHARFGSRDLNPWVLDQLELAAGQRVLELGCGTGKQTLPVAEAVGEAGRVLAFDASAESLSELERAAAERHIDDRIETTRAEFDELGGTWGEEEFDRALSCYALYYAREPGAVMQAVASGLRPDGLFFFCGPARRNNAELKDFCDALRSAPIPEDDAAKDFMELGGVRAARSLFAEVDLLEFENPLRFDSAEGLYGYWSNYNLYDPAIDDDFRAAAERHFHAAPVFETVKRVRGVRARKGSV